MAFPNYTSCIKIAGYPILPPLMTEGRRLELNKDKEAALKVEQKLCRKESHPFVSNFDNDTLSQSCSGQYPISENSTSSADHTEKLMDFIKIALQDVQHSEEGRLLQNQILEELAKLNINKTGHSHTGSCDTLNNLDNFLPDENLSKDAASDCERFNFSEMENILHSSSEPCRSQNDSSQVLPDCDRQLVTPPKLVRRNSYTLQTPSTSIISYLKSLTQQEGTPNHCQDNRRPTAKSVSKNLNKIWTDDSRNSEEHDDSQYPDLSVLDVCNSTPLDISFDAGENDRDKNYNSNVSRRMPLGNSNRINISDRITPNHERAATIIQAGIRGYLVRRLLRTNKVVELKKTIKDCLIYALSLHAEQTVTPADVNLHVGLIRQVTAACYELHSIFFEWSIIEKMNLINQDRIKLQNQKVPKIAPSKLSRKYLKRTRSGSSSPSSRSNDSSRTSARQSPYSVSRSSSAVKYQPWK